MHAETMGRRRLFWAAVVLAVLLLALGATLVQATSALREALTRGLAGSPTGLRRRLAARAEGESG